MRLDLPYACTVLVLGSLAACEPLPQPATATSVTEAPAEGPTGSDPVPSQKRDEAVPAATESAGGAPTEPSGDEGQPRKVFSPSEPAFELSFGTFGPCDIEHDHRTGVSMVYCDRSDAPQQEGIVFNFYLPGVWSSGSLTAESVGREIVSKVDRNTTVEASFQAPDKTTGETVVFITMSAIYPDGGQGFVMKVAPIEDAVYSMSYSKLFSGPPSALRSTIRAWLARTVEEHGTELGALQPDEAWVQVLTERK